MDSRPSITQLVCLTTAFVAALLLFVYGTERSYGSRHDTLLFFVWATFIPWIATFGLLLFKQHRRPPL